MLPLATDRAHLSLYTCGAIIAIGYMLLSRLVAGRGASLAGAHFYILEGLSGLYYDGCKKPLEFKLKSFLSYPTAINYGIFLVRQHIRSGKYK